MNAPTPANTITGVVDPLFRAIDVPSLNDAHLTALACGTLAVVRLPAFLPPADCLRIIAGLDQVPLGSYDAERVHPPIFRFGPVLNDYRADGNLAEVYWVHTQQARITWRRARLHPDPIAVSLARIAKAWGRPVQPARVAGRDLFAGTLREINAGAHVHYDEVVREFPGGLFDQRVVAQLAFNLYLSIPEAGGQTCVWRRSWSPPDEAHRSGYGYDSEVITGAQHVTVAPEVGDGVFFNPRHYHAVTAAQGGRRITVAFFLAITGAGELIVWS